MFLSSKRMTILLHYVISHFILLYVKDGLTWAIQCNYWPADSDYTSLVSYAITKINSWTSLHTLDIDRADFTTLNGKYSVNVQLCEAEFTFYCDLRAALGYRVAWLDGYQVKRATFFNVIWVKDGIKGRCCHDVTTEMFTEVVKDAMDKCWVPIHVDSYISSTTTVVNSEGELRFAIIFVERTGSETGDSDYILKHDVASEALEAQTNTLREAGYSIKCQCPYLIDAECYVAVLYVRQPGGKLLSTWPKPCLHIDQYQAEFNRQTRYGHLPSYLKCYHGYDNQKTGDETKGENSKTFNNKNDMEIGDKILSESGDTPINFSAIWTDPGAYLYTAEHDMSRYRVLYDLLLVSQNGFRPLCIAGYQDDGGHKFAVVCVKQAPGKK